MNVRIAAAAARDREIRAILSLALGYASNKLELWAARLEGY